ncbi:MAG TPA: CDP-diacylglycerol--serine O-phosphatidyltransferase [bacterium]
MKIDPKNKLSASKGIYILPNFFTSVSLFAGFYSILAAIHGNIEKSAIAILVAGMFDVLDGRVARWTNTASRFGTEYDSLSDLVSFGVAPAILVYLWILNIFGEWGWGAAFLFVACAAMRLARFNVQVSTIEKRYFIGLPTPGAAGLISATVLFYIKHNIETTPQKTIISLLSRPVDFLLNKPVDFIFSRPISFLIIVFAGSILMISSVKYRSLKDMEFFKTKPLMVMLLAIFLLVLFYVEPVKVLFTCLSIYFLSGPVETVIRKVGLLKDKDQNSAEARNSKVIHVDEAKRANGKN